MTVKSLQAGGDKVACQAGNSHQRQSKSPSATRVSVRMYLPPRQLCSVLGGSLLLRMA